ncbi:phospholysine phosphohistidine inorganic pyrophosphate phosphatase [Gracilinanus agilis]|uniref:phospholysine phosphohistidine inorganic pyrophosphate phosphatase n=1 Tax=Gracilinanus agilis TaxID=191870 RepID=UPI001CFE4FEA|nr:phospholysine phosphohistidine inorganic pyrophosphate phosphatase [Gracilinanus agilis]
MATAATAAWAPRLAGVRGLLLDISGVLYDGGEGGGTPIPGSIEAVARIKRSGLKLRFCTNESQKSRDKFVGLLQRLGFDISVNEVTSPAPAACQILKERGLRPHLLVHDDIRSEFSEMDTSNPNCVVIADAGEGFSYQNLNEAFRVLINLDNPVLISLGNGRYYKEADGLMLDVGPYTKALEYACDVQAEVVGKPAPEFFKAALKEMGLEAQQAVMIGDDIVGDVGGAQRCGLRALQVRTGKFRSVSYGIPLAHTSLTTCVIGGGLQGRRVGGPSLPVGGAEVPRGSGPGKDVGPASPLGRPLGLPGPSGAAAPRLGGAGRPPNKEGGRVGGGLVGGGAPVGILPVPEGFSPGGTERRAGFCLKAVGHRRDESDIPSSGVRPPRQLPWRPPCAPHSHALCRPEGSFPRVPRPDVPARKEAPPGHRLAPRRPGEGRLCQGSPGAKRLVEDLNP